MMIHFPLLSNKGYHKLLILITSNIDLGVKLLTLNEVNPGFNPGIVYGSLNTTRSKPGI